MAQKVNEIIIFIQSLTQDYDKQLQGELSPAQKNEVSHKLHCSLQALIFCVRTYSNEIYFAEDEVLVNLATIVFECLKWLDHPDLPMDTKNNCSILYVMHCKLIRNQLHIIASISDDASSPAKRLCLIFGYVNTLETKLDSTVCSLLVDISKILKQIFLKSSVDPSSMLSVCRSYMQLTKKLASIDFEHFTFGSMQPIINPALSVALLNVEHHMDSVRHLSRETLRNITDIGVKMDDGDMLDRIFKQIDQLSTMNLKSIVWLSILPALDMQHMSEHFSMPQFHYRLLEALSDNQVINHNLINCYEAWAMKLFNDVPFDRWFRWFVERLIPGDGNTPEERLMLENLMVRFVKKDKKILDQMLKIRGGLKFGFVLLCLSAGKKTGCFDKELSTEDLWKGAIGFDEIKKAMLSADDSVRTSAFMLIVESRKTTEEFTAQDFDCIMHFLKYNINVQSPAMRQSILGNVKNLFVRVQAVSQLLIKKKKLEEADVYFRFLANLQEFCLDNLFEGANFTRRTLSLRILFYIMEAVGEHFKAKATDIWSQRKFDVLMNVLNDSYEANKEMAIEIMKFMPKTVLREFSSVSLTQLKSMLTSIKPQVSLTASYLLEFAATFYDDFEGETSEVVPQFFFLLTWCEKLLLDGLEVAEKSLIIASSMNPLYGILLGVRHLISKLDLKKLGACKLWQDFFRRLVIVCKRLTAAVAPVVNNSSPEGILPKLEIDELEEETRVEWTRIAEQTTPQIILLCSWRTIKEVSLLLGDICLRVPLDSGSGIGLLNVEQFLNIGDHFLELLSKTKHRGAFEQCFFGFSQLCLRLWTCDEPELHQLPSEMLNQMITSISGHDKENNELLSMKNLCATRRSAGLPFMIQALITSELKVSTNKNFHFVMKNLIQFCRHGEYLETRTHSLNILRALFRCSDLNEAIGEYIAEGIKCAILGYGAESWIETNSSTLLFSSLMVRIFGVQRTKDSEDLGVRNRMTGRIFFLRYPELYDFFMEQLKEAAEHVQAVKMNAKLHPLLLLLFRLYPSALEGSESNLTLTGFIPVVSLCSGCVEMKTRVLCAKFIASVSPPDLLMSRLEETIEILKENENLPGNISHGILLQILHLVRAIPAVREIQGNNALSVLEIFKKVMPLSKRYKKQLVCFGTFMDIAIEICEKLWHVKKHQTTVKQAESSVFLDSLIYFKPGENSFATKMNELLASCFDFDAAATFGLPIIAKKIFLIKFIKFALGDRKERLFELSPSMNFYTLQSMLSIILLELNFDYAMSLADEYEIDSKEIFFVKNSDRMNLSELAAIPTRIGDFPSMIKSFDIRSFTFYERGSLKLEHVQKMIQAAMLASEHLKKSMLKFVSGILRSGDFLNDIDFSFLVEISTDASLFVK